MAARVGEADRHQRRHLIVLGIGVRAQDRRKSSRRVRAIDVRIEDVARAHRNGDVAIHAQPVLAARRLPGLGEHEPSRGRGCFA
jgi:hypothetical protein